MTIFLTTISVILVMVVFFCLVYFFLSWFLAGPYSRFKRNTRYFTMEEISDTITTVCNLQFIIYDSNRFRESGPKLTNSSFENYCKELSERCLNSLSDEFYNKASMYMKEDAIALMIYELVRNYLTTKIGIDESANFTEETTNE